MVKETDQIFLMLSCCILRMFNLLLILLAALKHPSFRETRTLTEVTCDQKFNHANEQKALSAMCEK